MGKRYLSAVLCVMLTAAMLIGCGADAAKTDAAGQTDTAGDAGASETSSNAKKDDATSGDARKADVPDAAGAEEAEWMTEAGEDGVVWGGTDISDAIPLPMGTKVYGWAEWEKPLWYAFTTGENEEDSYEFLCVNKTVGYRDVDIAFYDEAGNCLLAGGKLGGNGRGEIGYTDMEWMRDADNAYGTKPNTTYYVRVTAGWSSMEWDDTEPLYFMICAREKDDAKKAAASLTSNLSESKGKRDAREGKIHPGTNMDDAQVIPFDVAISGTTVVGGFCGLHLPRRTQSMRIMFLRMSTIPGKAQFIWCCTMNMRTVISACLPQRAGRSRSA